MKPAPRDRARELSRLWRAHQRSQSNAPADAHIGIAGSFTVDPLADLLGALLLEAGRKSPSVANANYNQIVRTCLDPASEFGSSDLEMIVLLWRLEDLTTSSAAESAASALHTLLDAFRQLRANFSGTIVISLPPRPRAATEGLVGFARPGAFEQLWYEALAKVSALARELPNTYSIDLEAQIAELGEAESLDYRKELLYRQPYTEAYFTRIGERLMRIYSARRYEPKKCIVVDCDNTLWGGVIGEDGVGGVQLSDDYPGRAFLEFQRQLRVLRDSGIFLAICTKNNPDDVTEMFEKHASMAIRLADLSVSKVNWQPKSENLKEIARELNIGIDALVFVDDNPFEIEEVRTNAPEVTCIQVPEDTAELPALIRAASRLFDRLEITEDDRKRVDMMRQEMERRELSQKLTTTDFLASLELQIDLYIPQPADHARVTQLINKTNQFNVTTRRYTFEDVAAMLADPDVDLYCASVRDKFGDYGLVGVGIVRHGAGTSEFDTLLMSCRVLGRGVEAAMISHGIALAAARGNAGMVGRYIATRKNAMVADLFEKHGFEVAASEADGKRLTRATATLEVPVFLKVNLGKAA
jgi:FkbH-like protein